MKVSIVTPSFNQGQFIEDTILSVLGQTYHNIEYILVDGGSTDSTLSIVERYRNRIDVVICEKDRGQSDAINKGFKAATGELVGWINSDDILYENCVENIVNLYKKNPNGAIFYGSINDWINYNGNVIGNRNIRISNRDHLLNHNYNLIQQGSFYPNRLVKQIGYLNESIHYCMDLDLWLRLLKLGPIYDFSEYPIAGFRVWDETKTNTGGDFFLRDIRKTLLTHGSRPFSIAVIKTRYFSIKQQMKKFFLSV